MSDYLTQLFLNQDVLGLFFILFFSLAGYLSMRFFYKKNYILLFAQYIILLLSLFTTIPQGMNINYVILPIIIVSGLITYLYSKTYSEGVAESNKILLSYTVFFVSMLFLESLAGITFFTMGLNPKQFPPTCSMGYLIIDGLLWCAWNYITIFFNFFNITSTITIINTILFIPFIIFLAKIILDLLRGR
jgi:hypothetical protein